MGLLISELLTEPLAMGEAPPFLQKGKLRDLGCLGNHGLRSVPVAQPPDSPVRLLNMN